MEKNNVLTLRVHIPCWSEDEHPFTIEGCETEDTLKRVTGYSPDFEKVVWDIDLENGTVMNWNGEEVDMFDKLRDEGVYELYYGETLVCKKEGYVPEFLYIGEGCGYGDYIQMSVEKDGHIKEWNDRINDCLDYFGAANSKIIDEDGGFHQWFERVSREKYEDGEEEQVLTPETVFISKSGNAMELSEIILNFLKS